MILTVKHVNFNFAAQFWPKVESFIESAQQHAGNDYTLDQVKMYVNTGQWTLLVAVDEADVVCGAATVMFINSPNDRVAFITTMGGKLITNQDTFAQLKTVLKNLGATKIQGASRPSVIRLWKRFGFNERYTTVEVTI
jgi:hypothetical protein